MSDITIVDGSITIKSRKVSRNDGGRPILLEVWQYGIRRGWFYVNEEEEKRMIRDVKRELELFNREIIQLNKAPEGA